MIIKKRPILSWLYNTSKNISPKGISIPNVSPSSKLHLKMCFEQLDYIRSQAPDWGLPQMVMPSFEDAMRKNLESFQDESETLFKEFCKDGEFGVLLCKKNDTIIYGFGDDILNVWYFVEIGKESVFKFCFSVKCEDDKLKIDDFGPTLFDNAIFSGPLHLRKNALHSIKSYITLFLAVKKYVPVETIVVPQGKFTDIKDTPLENIERNKIINQTGQEVIVMDSRWFRKIVNDNDIPVRGFFRNQRFKNEDREWDKKRIFINPFIRHGYHRMAKIENCDK